MKKAFVAGVGLLALATAMQPALAADLPVRAPVYRPPPPVIVVYSWTGCYIGGHGGGVWVQKDYTAPLGVPATTFTSAITGSYDLSSHDADTWLAGGQIGCNYQAGNWVFGIQGDYAWIDGNGSHALPGGLSALTVESRIRGLASVTGRVGYAWDRFLGYVKGGGAWEKDEYSVYVTGLPATVLATASETRSGWTLGVGGEYAFTDWVTGFVEYNYYDFGTRSVAYNPAFTAAPWDVREYKSVFKVGLNLKWGGSVSARY